MIIATKMVNGWIKEILPHAAIVELINPDHPHEHFEQEVPASPEILAQLRVDTSVRLFACVMTAHDVDGLLLPKPHAQGSG